MIRGTMCIVKDKKIYYHDEFNGGMNLDTYGLEALNVLENSTDFESFEKNVEFFNKNHFEYDPFNFFNDKLNKSILNLKRNYSYWFSDYLYVKNLDKDPVIFTDAKNEEITLNQNDIVVFHYGEHIKQEEINQAKEKQELGMEL